MNASKISEAESILNDVLHLANLIRAAAFEISESSVDDRQAILQALTDGSSIHTASQIIIEKIETASTILICAR